ncbi:MAG: hypothetical protein ACK2T6_05835 [Anaerolineae bacterium]|jgi:hypothetical protein
MRRLVIAVVAAVGVVLLLGVAPTLAQDIYGLSLRPTDMLDELSARGTVDIVADGDGYLVSVDLSAAIDELKLDDFGSAEGFVAWVVDMNGDVINAGTLDRNLVLEDAQVGSVVAKVFVTAEGNADGAVPSGDRLYELTLRNVAETAQPASQSDDESTAADEDSDTEEAAGESEEATEDEDAASDDEAATDEGEDEESATDAKPAELPTTGGDTRDMLVLLAVSAVLLLGALRLRTLRV